MFKIFDIIRYHIDIITKKNCFIRNWNSRCYKLFIFYYGKLLESKSWWKIIFDSDSHPEFLITFIAKNRWLRSRNYVGLIELLSNEPSCIRHDPLFQTTPLTCSKFSKMFHAKKSNIILRISTFHTDFQLEYDIKFLNF